MPLPRITLPEPISEELRSQLWKDFASDFSGQTILGFIVAVTGNRIGQSAIAGSVVFLIIIIVIIRHHRRIKRLKAAAKSQGTWVGISRKDF